MAATFSSFIESDLNQYLIQSEMSLPDGVSLSSLATAIENAIRGIQVLEPSFYSTNKNNIFTILISQLSTAPELTSSSSPDGTVHIAHAKIEAATKRILMEYRSEQVRLKHVQLQQDKMMPTSSFSFFPSLELLSHIRFTLSEGFYVEYNYDELVKKFAEGDFSILDSFSPQNLLPFLCHTEKNRPPLFTLLPETYLEQLFQHALNYYQCDQRHSKLQSSQSLKQLHRGYLHGDRLRRSLATSPAEIETYCSILFWALYCKKDQTTINDLLVDIQQSLKNGKIPLVYFAELLYWAIRFNRPDITRLVVDKLQTPEQKQLLTKSLYTELLFVFDNQTGQHILSDNGNRFSLLQLAIIYDQPEIFKMLWTQIIVQSTSSSSSSSSYCSSEDKFWLQELRLAAEHSPVIFCDLLSTCLANLSKKPNPMMEKIIHELCVIADDSKKPLTPLMVAIATGNEFLVRQLLSYGADVTRKTDQASYLAARKHDLNIWGNQLMLDIAKNQHFESDIVISALSARQKSIKAKK